MAAVCHSMRAAGITTQTGACTIVRISRSFFTRCSLGMLLVRVPCSHAHLKQPSITIVVAAQAPARPKLISLKIGARNMTPCRDLRASHGHGARVIEYAHEPQLRSIDFG